MAESECARDGVPENVSIDLAENDENDGTFEIDNHITKT